MTSKDHQTVPLNKAYLSLYLLLDGILQIPNLSSLGIQDTERDYFPKQQQCYFEIPT